MGKYTLFSSIGRCMPPSSPNNHQWCHLELNSVLLPLPQPITCTKLKLMWGTGDLVGSSPGCKVLTFHEVFKCLTWNAMSAPALVGTWFALDQNRVTCGVVFIIEDLVNLRKIGVNVIWGRKALPRPKGQEHVKEMWFFSLCSATHHRDSSSALSSL